MKPTPKAQDIWSKCDKTFPDFKRIGEAEYNFSMGTCRTQYSKCRKYFANGEVPVTASAGVNVEVKPVTNKFDELAEKYNVPAECIERGFQACINAGVDTDYYVKKYILKEPVETKKQVIEEYKKLMYLR